MDSPELAMSAMYRILKRSGAARVSDESAAELRSVVEEFAASVASMAVKASMHANRRTVRADDVRFACRALSDGIPGAPRGVAGAAASSAGARPRPGRGPKAARGAADVAASPQ